MNYEQFREAVVRDQAALAERTEAPHAAGCPCNDCYFERFGAEIEPHPISALRIVRGGCMADGAEPTAATAL